MGGPADLKEAIRARLGLDTPAASVAVSRDGRSVFVSAPAAGQVVELDTDTLTVVRSVLVAGEPAGVASTPVMPRATCHACTAAE